MELTVVAELRQEGQRNLLLLLPPDAELEFPHAWGVAVEYASRMADGLDTERRDSGRQ